MLDLTGLEQFRSVVVADFEFIAAPGERPLPVCLVARELRTGRAFRLWQHELEALPAPPYPTGPDTLFIAYFASAELGCHLALGWPMPERVLDLFCEFRNGTNGRPAAGGNGLLSALAHHGLESITAAAKDRGRELVMRGGPWSDDERVEVLDYCETDVAALERLLPKMLPQISVPHALNRGRFMRAVASMEHRGVPIDQELLQQLREGWDQAKLALIADADRDYGIFNGTTFKADRFAHWLAANNIAWPRTGTGALALDDDAFKLMAREEPRVRGLHVLRRSLADMRLFRDLQVGADGRNRAMLSPFRSRTGRNQPSPAKFIFGPARWLRGLVKPGPGRALVVADWQAQEIGIAAYLSGDRNLVAAYESGDPYLAFGKQCGRIPETATKATHKAERDAFKAVVLGVNYGMMAESLARQIGGPVALASSLLRQHREVYADFWRWSDGAVAYATSHGRLWTAFGWDLQVGADANGRSLRNHLCQANGAEMLRWACSLLVERGVELLAPVHDALVVEGPAGSIELVAHQVELAMRNASAAVLGGPELRVETRVVRWPDRLADGGEDSWNRVIGLVTAGVGVDTPPVRKCG